MDSNFCIHFFKLNSLRVPVALKVQSNFLTSSNFISWQAATLANSYIKYALDLKCGN
jgi:hypothetical protein